MTIFSDIDTSLDFNIYQDFGKLTDKTSIVNTFKNNLFIGSQERPLNNNNEVNIKSLLQKFDSAIGREYIEECIENAAGRDDRISQILNIDLDFDIDNFTLYINVTLELDTVFREEERIINFDLILKDD
jgi:hypothetical protein